jgi:hypothetical protein
MLTGTKYAMRIGIDFDNTIVCYDQVFHEVALERQLISKDVPVSKSAVRDHLRSIGREDDWTEMQGFVYGPGMVRARPFPGVLETLRQFIDQDYDLFIVSHKTLNPYRGRKYDLHAAARNWLEHHGIFDPSRVGIPRSNAFFELTLKEKLSRIAKLSCTHFVDDLPELLAETDFPSNTRPILFDPNHSHQTAGNFTRIQSWDGLRGVLKAA